MGWTLVDQGMGLGMAGLRYFVVKWAWGLVAAVGERKRRRPGPGPGLLRRNCGLQVECRWLVCAGSLEIKRS